MLYFGAHSPMLRPILFSLLLSLPASITFAQKHTEEFQLPKPESIVSGSLYNRIQLLDLREDTTIVGVIQTGGFNRQTRLIPNPNLDRQLSFVLREMAPPATAQEGELLLRLRQFRISEITAGLSETGYCVLQADLLTNTNGQYQMLARLDELEEVRGKLDVTKSTIERGSRLLLNFLAQNLNRRPTGNTFLTYKEVLFLDSVEKQLVPVYNLTGGFTDGLYQTYSDFAKQSPQEQLTAEARDGQLYKVRSAEYGNGKRGDKIKPGDAYAIVHKGVPYIGTDYGYYELRKEENEFIFTGKVKATPANAGVIAASVAFGLIGGLIASSATGNDLYEMKIDYRNGNPIFLRKAP
jgi:hypothetical protein